MSSMNYQKVYMNQIHSSSLLCQLSHMWKSQMLCDAIIKTGQIITKAHRVVLVAACPMLQSMENASAGSHLEVRLAADIKQESVNTFLQYLYEGFMMLTEENVHDVEKVARLLQVDSVIKCCADFYKCMNAKTGAPFPGSTYKYSFSGHDLAEFRHVRATDLQKTVHERMMKRVSDFPRPGSPGSKRPKLHKGGSPSDVTVIADDTASMSHSYMSGAPDPWDRVPRLGSGMGSRNATGRPAVQPGVIEIVEESIELVQTEPPEKDSGQASSRSSQKTAAVSVAVSSQYNAEPEISVVNIFGNPDVSSQSPVATAVTSSSSSRGSITVSPLTIFQEPRPSQSSSAPDPPSSSSTAFNTSSSQDQVHFQGFSQRSETDNMFSVGKPPRSSESQVTSTPMSQPRPFSMSASPINQSKPFAIGSAMQAGMSSPSSHPMGSPSSSKPINPRSAPASPAERARDGRRSSEGVTLPSTADLTPDLTIVKIEASNHETGGLDMHVDMPEEGVMHIHSGRIPPDDQDDVSDKEIEDWAREEMSNEGSNISGDQNNSWYMGTFKEWLQNHGYSQQVEQIPFVELNDILSQFYVDLATNQRSPARVDANTLRDIRDTIMDYLMSCHGNWDNAVISMDTFHSSNLMIENLAKNIKDSQWGKTRSLKRCSISRVDLGLLVGSGLLSVDTPLGLLRKVWFDLTVHLGCAGQDALRSLNINSFALHTDEHGKKYYCLTHDMSKETARSFQEMQYWNWEGRMYEIVDDQSLCPVHSLSLYLSKRNLQKDAFFQRPKLFLRPGDQCWYDMPVGHCFLATFMSKMSEEANLSRLYTNTSVRLTVANFLLDMGLHAETVMGPHPRFKPLNVFRFQGTNKSSEERMADSMLLHNAMYRKI